MTTMTSTGIGCVGGLNMPRLGAPALQLVGENGLGPLSCNDCSVGGAGTKLPEPVHNPTELASAVRPTFACGPPHRAARKGDPITATTAMGRVIARPAVAGYWERSASFDSPASADVAATDLLSGLTDDVATWQMLGSRFRMGITVHEARSPATQETIFSTATLALFRQRD